MGWLWSSSADQSPSPTQEQDPPPPGPPFDSSPAPEPIDSTPDSTPSTLHLTLKALDDATTPPHARKPLPPPPPLSTYGSAPLLKPEHLYPTSTSTRQAFDAAIQCQSPQGQFRNVYRYGTFRKCGEQWGEFWWSLRTNRAWVSEEKRRERCLRHGWERDMRIRSEGSSEGVWRQRMRLIKGGWGGEGQPGGPRDGVGPFEGGEEGVVRTEGGVRIEGGEVEGGSY